MKTLYNVQRRTFTTTFLLFASSALLVLLAACVPQGAGTHTTTFGTSSVAASATTKPMPPTQTSCPANGQGRPAVTAPLAHGKQQTVVYVDTSSSKSTLKSYNVSTGQTTTLASVSGSSLVALVDAQVSTDGQYVLFISGRELQMIRKDGQGLQTLYCYPQRTGVPGNLMNLLWSSNQQLAVFEEPSVYGGQRGGQQIQPLPPSLITAQPARGGTLRPIYVSHVHAVVQTRLSNQAMLFVIEDSASVEGPQDGLWKINLDGTGLTQLVHGHTVLAGTRTTWANVSRDGTFYAAVNNTVQGAGVSTEVYVGPLNGGTPKRFIATNDTIAIAGWTTL